MVLIRSIARPLLAATFITGGIDTLRNPAPKVPAAEPVVAPIVDKVDQVDNTEQLVKLDAAVKVVGGSLLALGWFPRIASLALAGSLVPTTIAGHAFWKESDRDAKKQQQLHFVKNASMLGGLLLAAVDTEGKPSLAWRLRRTPKVIARAASDVRRDSELAVRSAGDSLHHATSAALDKLPI